MGLAGAIANGEVLAGLQCQRGTVVYLDAENGEREIHRRVHNLSLPAAGVLVADASMLNLRRGIGEIEALITQKHPDLLVIDSLRSMTPGMDENDTEQTARALDPLRRLAHTSGTTILLIHHANKAGQEFRGASSIRDGVDVMWHLGREPGDPDSRRRFLHNRKMRVAADGEQLWLRLEPDREHVLIEQAQPPDPTDLAAVARPIRTALSDEILSCTDSAERLRLADIAALVGRDPKDGSVRNAMTALINAGLFMHDGNSYIKVQPGLSARSDAPRSPSKRVQSAIPAGGPAPLHHELRDLDADAELEHLAGRGLAG
jgi:hypothetical protein